MRSGYIKLTLCVQIFALVCRLRRFGVSLEQIKVGLSSSCLNHLYQTSAQTMSSSNCLQVWCKFGTITLFTDFGETLKGITQNHYNDQYSDYDNDEDYDDDGQKLVYKVYKGLQRLFASVHNSNTN